MIDRQVIHNEDEVSAQALVLSYVYKGPCACLVLVVIVETKFSSVVITSLLLENLINIRIKSLKKIKSNKEI